MARASSGDLLRFYWDCHDAPSIEVPFGDLFCNGWGTFAPVNSISVVAAGPAMAPQAGEDVVAVPPDRLDHDERCIDRYRPEGLDPHPLAVDEPVTLDRVEGMCFD
jgi:hypothetical protein